MNTGKFEEQLFHRIPPVAASILCFLCFQGIWKENIDLKRVNTVKTNTCKIVNNNNCAIATTLLRFPEFYLFFLEFYLLLTEKQ